MMSIAQAKMPPAIATATPTQNSHHVGPNTTPGPPMMKPRTIVPTAIHDTGRPCAPYGIVASFAVWTSNVSLSLPHRRAKHNLGTGRPRRPRSGRPALDLRSARERISVPRGPPSEPSSQVVRPPYDG